MLIRQETLREIAAGRVTLAFRRWQRPSVRAGGRLRTAVGELRIEAVEPTTLARITAADARQAGFESRAALLRALARGKQGDLYRIRLAYAGADPRVTLRALDRLTHADIADIRERLDALDRRSHRPPWTRAILRAIEESPGTLAEDMAAEFGRTKPAFKADVRFGIRRASRTMSALRTRMHPCDGRPGISDGWFVPWMPTTPPPGQSDSDE